MPSAPSLLPIATPATAGMSGRPDPAISAIAPPPQAEAGNASPGALAGKAAAPKADFAEILARLSGNPGTPAEAAKAAIAGTAARFAEGEANPPDTLPGGEAQADQDPIVPDAETDAAPPPPGDRIAESPIIEPIVLPNVAAPLQAEVQPGDGAEDQSPGLPRQSPDQPGSTPRLPVRPTGTGEAEPGPEKASAAPATTSPPAATVRHPAEAGGTDTPGDNALHRLASTDALREHPRPARPETGGHAANPQPASQPGMTEAAPEARIPSAEPAPVPIPRTPIPGIFEATTGTATRQAWGSSSHAPLPLSRQDASQYSLLPGNAAEAKPLPENAPETPDQKPFQATQSPPAPSNDGLKATPASPVPARQGAPGLAITEAAVTLRPQPTPNAGHQAGPATTPATAPASETAQFRPIRPAAAETQMHEAAPARPPAGTANALPEQAAVAIMSAPPRMPRRAEAPAAPFAAQGTTPLAETAAMDLRQAPDPAPDLAVIPAQNALQHVRLIPPGLSHAAHPGQLAHDMARQIAGAVAEPSNRPVELRLDPEELGLVRLTLSGNEQSLAMTITAERGETLDLLRRHIAALEQEYRALGYTDIQFSFGTGGDSGQGSTASPSPTSETAPHRAPESAATPHPRHSGNGTGPDTGLDLRL